MRALTISLTLWLCVGCDDGQEATRPDSGRGAADQGAQADGSVDPIDAAPDAADPDAAAVEPDEGVIDGSLSPDGAVVVPDEGLPPDGAPLDPPLAEDLDEVRVHQGSAVELTLEGSGGEGALTITIADWPADGVLSRDGVELVADDLPLPAPLVLTYTPNDGFWGRDRFEFTVGDDAGQTSAPGTVRLFVNGLPNAVDDIAETVEDVAVEIPVLVNDSDPEGAVTISDFEQPENGVVGLIIGGVSYTPAPGFNGEDSFGYTVRDRDGATASARVTVTVHAANDRPEALPPRALFTDEDIPVEIELTGTDEEDAEADLVVRVTVLPEHGALDVEEGAAPLTITFTPEAEFSGGDRLTFVVVDSEGAVSEPLDLLINVQAVDDPPVAVDDEARTPEEVSARIRVVANDIDIDSPRDDLLVVRTTPPENGSVQIGPGDLQTVTYTPDDGFAGQDTFTYTVRDGGGGEDSATVTVTVEGENDPPRAVPLPDQVVEEDGALDLVLTGEDEEEPIENLTVLITVPPLNGQLEVDPNPDGEPTVAPWATRYRPNPDFSGEDGFTFVVEDGAGELSPEVQVSIRVTPVNDPPIARDDFTRTDTLTPVLIDIQANDTDVDDPILRVVDVTDPPFGEVVSRGDGRLLYTPTHPDAGEARFEYTLVDGAGERSTAQVTVDVALAEVVEVEVFAATPDTVTEGRSAVLAWAVARAESCRIDPDLGEVAADGGELEVSPLATTDYRITCEGPGGPAGAVARVTVLPDSDRDGISDAREIELDYLPGDPDSDGDGLLDGVEDVDQDGVVDEGETGVLDADTDDDGLPDGFEDADGDGEVDADETDPRDPDSDDDGQCDFVREDNEVPPDGLQPEDPCEPPVPAVAIEAFGAVPAIPLRGEPTTLSWRTIAADGCAIEPGVGAVDPPQQGGVEVVPDGETTYTLTCTGPGPDVVAEVRVLPDADADGDGIPNRLEELLGYDPALADSDDDGLDDGVEDPNHDGLSPGETDVNNPDSDDDGIEDGTEDANGDRVVQADETDPLDPDTDADGLRDGVEDANADGVFGDGETNPLDRDTDDDSLFDGLEDANQDGVVDDGETDPRDPDTDNDNRCDAIRADNDNDGIGPPDDCVGSEAFTGIWFVDASHEGRATGLFWTAPYTRVDQAMLRARDGDQVWIAAGRYRPSGPGRSVMRMVDGVEVYGGFQGDELEVGARQEPLLPTVLDGDFGGDGRDANDAEHVVVGASRALLDGFTVTGGNRPVADDLGGAGLLAEAVDALVVSRVVFRENLAQLGGGVLVRGGAVVFEDVLFDANTATAGGGGLFADDSAQVTLTRARFEGNRSVGTGGGATVEALSVLTGETARFFENEAAVSGGGLAVEAGGRVELFDARFEGNSAEVSGGAVSAEAEATVELEQALFFSNVAGLSGGALAAEDFSNLVLTGSTLVGNQAADAGGAISAEEDSGATLTEVLVVGNHALLGGAVFCAGLSTLQLSDAAIRDNVADEEGGGLYVEDEAEVDIARGYIAGNTSGTFGGGIFASFATLNAVDMVVTGNSAVEAGGGVAAEEEAIVALTSSTLSGNRATIGAGIRVVGAVELTLNNATLADNEGEAGGGVHVDEESVVGIYNLAAFGNVPDAVGVADIEEFDLDIEGGCVDQDLEPLDGLDLALLDADPFVRAASGEVFLVQDGACVNSGDAELVEDVLAALGIDWRQRTTDRSAEALDVGRIDAGHHHDPAATWIAVLDAPTPITVDYAINGVRSCVLGNDGGGETVEVEPGVGQHAHALAPGTLFTLRCGGSVAEVVVPEPPALP